MYDLVVAGAGPAGLATAILAAERGLSVVVLDRRGSPIDKACGEGVMPAGVTLLRRLGLDLPAVSTRPFAGVRFIDGSHIAEGHFRGRPGLGIRRSVLSVALISRADRIGAQLRFGVAVRSWRVVDGGVEIDSTAGRLRSRLLVGADGLHSLVRRQAGVELPVRGQPRYGVRQHFRVRPWTNLVEVHWGDGVEAYVTPVNDEEIGIALLWSSRSGEPQSFERLITRFPALAERMKGAAASSSVRGGGPFRQRLRAVTAGPVALVGDAAGFVDPISGDGITLGLRAAEALIATVAAGAPMSRYEELHRRMFRDYARLTETLLLLADHPRLRHASIRLLGRLPGVFSRLVDLNGGEQLVETPLVPRLEPVNLQGI